MGFRQGFQKTGINKDCGGGMEKTHLVFQVMKINSCFSTDSRVDHSHQAGRDVDISDATFKACSNKSAHISNDPAAQVDQEALPVGLRGKQFNPYLLSSNKGFGCLFSFDLKH